ncbi:MAG: tetratricopeptide repeat protein [Bdellovibrionaceae bacterium]|nr:tetratricopeptide repeat protein [Pseudobdellovibrionaceae bacterium]
MKSVRILALIFALPIYVHAQTSAPSQASSGAPTKLPAKKGGSSRVGLDAAKTMRLNYGYPMWNKSPSSVDTASLLMREGATGRLVQIQLEETEPDSSVFTGLFSVQWDRITQLAPEFYVPPQELLETNQGLKKLSAMIATGQLKRVPFLLRRGKNGQQNIEIFDNKEQARKAMQIYRAEREALELLKKKVVSDSAMEAADLAQAASLKEAAATAAADRIRLEQVEARKELERQADFARKNAEEQARRKAEAARLAQEAMAHYQAGQIPDALAKFEKAYELDPNEKTYYFQYGVVLYRSDRFNESLVFLNMADGPDVNTAEREYYRALNHYRLKDMTSAVDSFKKVEAAKHPELSPSSSFYIGMIHYEGKAYEDARNAFQTVLDTSKDPKLDERAEMMIEQILRVQQFEAERAKKWYLTATVGINYDSNVLQTSTSSLDTGSASDAIGYRFLQQASLRYRPIYETNKEFAAQLDLLNMYTLDKSFQSDQDLRNTDPLVIGLTLPYTHKGLLAGKGYKVDFVPGYETIYMSIENNENKAILSSFIFNILNTVIMNQNWFANYNLEMRQDESGLESATGTEDSSAFKTKLAWNNYFFLNQEKNRIFTADLSYTSNQAKGDNAVYDRLDLGVGYVGQTVWDMTYNPKLSYFQLAYTKNSNGRTDNSITASVALSKKLTEKYSTGLMTSYNLNDSNVEANQYNRMSIMLTLSGAWNL